MRSHKNPYSLTLVILMIAAACPAETPTNAQAVVDQYRKDAEKGNAQAEFNLSECYRTGNGITRDLTASHEWLNKAAEHGHAEAQYLIGQKFEIEKIDMNEAMKWYLKSATQGYPNAMMELAVQYAMDSTNEANVVKSYMWATLAETGGTTKATALKKILTGKMSATQIAEADRLAREMQSSFKK